MRVLSTAAFLAMVSSCTTAAFADTYDLTDGSVTVNAKSDGTYVTQTDTDGNFCTNKNGDTLNNYEDKTPVTLTTSGEEPTHNTASISTEIFRTPSSMPRRMARKRCDETVRSGDAASK